MEEEISLREIIEILLKGKWIIAFITAISICISALLSIFVMSPVYETEARVIVNKSSIEDSSLNDYLNELLSPQVYANYIQSPRFLNSVIEKAKLDKNVWKAGSLKNQLEINIDDVSQVISVKLKGNDPEIISTILNIIIAESKGSIAKETKDKLDQMQKHYQEKMNIEQQNIDLAIKEYNDLNVGTGLPALILFEQTASFGKQNSSDENNFQNSKYVLEANKELLEELRGLNKEEEIKYKKINAKIDKLSQIYNNYLNKVEDIRSVSVNEFVESKVNVLANASVPSGSIFPNKVLNIAIATLVGIMIGTFIVFFRNYWQRSSTNKNVVKTKSGIGM